MLTLRQEQRLYHLSATLGVEIFLVGVGRWSFLPKQISSPGKALTRDEGLAPWVIRALDHPRSQLWWTHTHPNFTPFFSIDDIEGARALFDAVQRPILATVLGSTGNEMTRHTELINKEWYAAHPLDLVDRPVTIFRPHYAPYYSQTPFYGQSFHRVELSELQRENLSELKIALLTLANRYGSKLVLDTLMDEFLITPTWE